MSRRPHPAKYSAALLPVIAEQLDGYTKVLDPMAGVGTLARYLAGKNQHVVFSNELESEWALQCPWPYTVGDARFLVYRDGFFDAVCTSPAYGNRMADRYAGDRKGSRRHTYRIDLGRVLTVGSGASLQWGQAYRELHRAIWYEACRVLRSGGRLICNVSDHIRDGERQQVSEWHRDTLVLLGLQLVKQIDVETPRNGHGANGKLRVESEQVYVFDKP